MTVFSFTFLFNVPGLSNPFASSVPAAPGIRAGTSGRDIHSLAQSESHPQSKPDTQFLRRDFDGARAETGLEADTLQATPAPLYKRRPLPTGPPPVPLVRKRGRQSSPTESSSQTPSLKPSDGILFDMEQRSIANACDKRVDEDADIDAPPSKRRKGIAESVISTAFNAALVGAAVGLTVFRLWKDRGKETEQSPPPPYQEEWANPAATTSQPESASQPVRPHFKAHASSSAHKRHGGSIRHRQKVARKTIHAKRDKELSPGLSSRFQQDESVGNSSIASRSGEDDTLDEMDWIGDRLAQLIEEGKRALGTEIVVASESPEDEVDDGNGNWTEEEDAAEASASFSLSQHVISATPSGRSHRRNALSMSNSELSHLSTFPSHSRFHSDDLTSNLQSTPVRTGSASSSFMSDTNESESPSIRESMERARAAYLQKRGLGINLQGLGPS